ncbi:MAG: class I SAM-dependent methyltransferase [Deltaproteobacteria bacterium]|nr:class I SAM-dependent methyltransferase [Deltaproteobacteria bacterium]
MMNNNLVKSVKLNAQETLLGEKHFPMTPEQILIEETWERFLEATLGPEMQPEELEALERALKKFKGISEQKLENPFFWESWAPTWAEYSRRNLTRGLLLLNRLGRIEPHQKIISVGAGSCWQEVFLAQYCCFDGKVYGVDFSHHMIKQGTLLAQKRKIENVHFMVGKAEHLPLAENSGDLIVSFNLLDLIADVPRVLLEIKRILSETPQGRYFFVFPLNPRDRLKSKAEAWKMMMIQAGLETPRLFCLSGKNYKGKSLRLMVLTNIEPVG